jgi:uncharacterized repeat protein (TIGR01451 family)
MFCKVKGGLTPIAFSTLARWLSIVVVFLWCGEINKALGSPITTNVVLLSTTNSRLVRYSYPGPETFTNVVLREVLAPSFTFLSVQTSTGSLASIVTSNPIVLLVSSLAPTNGKPIFSYSFVPTQMGYFTNLTMGTWTNPAPGFAEDQTIYKVVSSLSDLAVGVSGPTDIQLAGDRVAYTIAITNKGPADAPGVLLSNYFGLGASVRSVSTQVGAVVGGAVAPFSSSSTNVTLNIGTLPNNGFKQFQVIMDLSTNLGRFDFVSAAFSTLTNNGDPIFLNDCVTNSFQLTNALPGVTAILESPMAPEVDHQTGLFTQNVRVSNAGATTIQSIRLSVQGLSLRSTNGLFDILYNAVGTNNGSPFVVSPASLAPGQSVDILLEFFFPTRQPATGLTFTAIEVPFVNVTNLVTGVVPLALTNWWDSANRIMYVEFPSTLGKRYTIQYSDSISFSNVLNALPSIQAYANRIQWIDTGPPKTISAPTNDAARFYRVIATP